MKGWNSDEYWPFISCSLIFSCLRRINFCVGRISVVTFDLHRDPHAEKTDGVNGQESVKGQDPLQQKCPESAEQRHSRGFQSLGKDEVPGSIR